MVVNDWTKEPWQHETLWDDGPCKGPCQHVVKTCFGQLIACGLKPENAKRIVACVNALAPGGMVERLVEMAELVAPDLNQHSSTTHELEHWTATVKALLPTKEEADANPS